MEYVPSPARFFLLRFAAWLAAGIGLAALLSWLSIKLQVAGFAPFGLFSLLLGAALGGGLVLLLRVLGVGHRWTLLIATFLLALVMVAGQFWFAHRDYVAQLEAGIRRNPKGAFFLESEDGFMPSFTRWLAASAREESRLAYWITDGVLISATAIVGVWLALRAPYCNGCRSWYRTSRSGPLTCSAGNQLAVAAEADCVLPDDAEAIRYRLESCRTGCGPARLELSWKVAGQEGRGRHWLDHAERTAVEAQLNSPPVS